jgi:DNA polymerase-3 subunit epsilon
MVLANVWLSPLEPVKGQRAESFQVLLQSGSHRTERYQRVTGGQRLSPTIALATSIVRESIPPMDIVIFDLETTGFSHAWSEIIQIAAVRMRDGHIFWDDTFTTFVRPVRRIPTFITEITGITDAEVEGAPSVTEALLSFSRFVGTSILLAHNARRFDMPFIREGCARHQLPVRQVGFVDSMDFSRKIWGGGVGHGLDAIIERLEISEDAARHTAPGDVAILAEAVLRMWRLLDFQPCPVDCESGFLPASSAA